MNWGFSGVMITWFRLAWDLRKYSTLWIYDNLQFNIPIGTNGDCYDRYHSSYEWNAWILSIIQQAINQLPEGPVKVMDNKISFPSRGEMKHSMEACNSSF